MSLQNLQISVNKIGKQTIASHMDSKNRLQLIYHPKIDSQKNYLLKVDKKFLEQLQKCQQLVIEGNPEQQVIINSPNNLYKLKGINISTCMLVINETGTVCQQTSTYLQVQQFTPHFHQIYKKIQQFSYKNIIHIKDKSISENIESFQQLLQNHSFTQQSIRKQCFIGELEFNRLSKAMRLVKITNKQEQQTNQYLYITLHFSVWIMREIIKIYNKFSINLFEPILPKAILQNMPILNMDILNHIYNYYSFQRTQMAQNQAGNQFMYKMSAKSIMRFIIGQMAISKKQYVCYMFDQVLDEMLMVYMPAQVQVTSQLLKQNKQKGKDKLYQELYACRFDYFIDMKGQKYIYYDYMEIQTQVNARLKFLSGYKNRWKSAQLKAIFRGLEFTQSGRYLPLSDFLLKKFRKYGDQYQIKFILPNK